MDNQYYFNKYPVDKEFYNSQNYCVEKVKAHILGKWHGSNDDWCGILTVPVVTDLSYFQKGIGCRAMWGKNSKYGENKDDGKHTLIAGEWPDAYFVYCANVHYSGQDYLWNLDELVTDYMSPHTEIIRSKNGTGLLVYSFESSNEEEYEFEMAYSIDLGRIYFNSNPRNSNDKKEFIKVARYVVWRASR